jgi:hypothetical protein
MVELNEDAGFVAEPLKPVVKPRKFTEFPKLVSAHIRESDKLALLEFAKAHGYARGSQSGVSSVVRLAIEEFMSKVKAAELIK